MYIDRVAANEGFKAEKNELKKERFVQRISEIK